MKKVLLAFLVLNLPLFAQSQELNFCAAVRGNGEYMLAHFGALARLTESYGALDGIAGGSSGSLTAFLYESLLLNPQVNNCKGKPCSKEERARRIAFFLKAGPEIIEVLKKSPEGLAVRQLLVLQEELKKKGITALMLEGKVTEASAALKVILESKEFNSMVNPDLFKLIKMGRGKEVYDQIANYGKWDVQDPSPFFKPGLINFKAAAETFGRLADFYAGRGPIEQGKIAALLDACSNADSLGKDWQALDEKCRADFHAIYTGYRANYDAAPAFDHRLVEPVGKTLPSLVSTSVLDGRVPSDLWRKNMAEFWRTSKPKYDFKPGFDKLKFGYWGSKDDLERVQKNLEGKQDLKSKKFLNLGPALWKDVLDKSPAEPGIANGQEIDLDHVSLGGWSDLHPIQVLKAMGCKNVVYVTRQGPESTFAVSVARQLGMTPKEEDQLYTLKSDGEPSSYQSALQLADGIWCTDWNHGSSADLMKLSKDTYEASMVTQAEFFQKPLQGGPKTVVPTWKVEGCDGHTGSVSTGGLREKSRRLVPGSHW